MSRLRSNAVRILLFVVSIWMLMMGVWMMYQDQSNVRVESVYPQRSETGCLERVK